METYGERGGIVREVLKWCVIGVVAIVALKVALAVAGIVFGLVVGLSLTILFTLGPILLAGWLVLKALRFFSRETGDFTV